MLNKNFTKIVLFGLLYFTISILSTSCKKSKHYFSGEIIEVSQFPDSLCVSGDSITGDVYTSVNFVSVDTFLIFFSVNYPDQIGKIYSSNSGKLIMDFAKRGRGPNEFLDLCTFCHVRKENSDWLISAMSLNNNEVNWINLSQSICQRRLIFSRRSKMEDHEKYNKFMYSPIFDLDSVNYLVRLVSKGYVEDENIMAEYTPPRYALLNSRGDSIKGYTLYPNPIVRDNSAKKEWSFVWNPDMLYMSADVLSSANKKLIMGMRLIGQINIVDIQSGAVIGLRQRNSQSFESIESDYNLDPKMEYMYISTGNDCFLALYNGVEKLLSTPIYSSDIIHVFDYNGNPLKMIRLDRKVTSISFEPNLKVLYGTTEYNGIFKFNLSKLL